MKSKEKSKASKENEDLKIEISEDTVYDEFQNEFYEFVCVFSGKMSLSVNDELKLLSAKNAILLSPDNKCVLNKLSEKNEKFKYLKLPVLVSFMENEFSECSELEAIVKRAGTPKVFRLSGSEISCLFAMAERISSQPNTDRKKYLYNKLIHRFCAVMLEGHSGKRLRTIKWFSSLVIEIDNMPAEEIDYGIILKKSGVTAKTLWQTFKKVYNMTPSEFIRKKKCEAAYDLIKNTDLSIGKISSSLGYGSYAQFYRDFYQIFGVSPAKQRRKKAKA